MRNRSRSPIRRRSRSRSPTRRSSGMRNRREVRDQSCRVYISNLNYEVKWMHVKDVFKKIGNVEHVEIFTDGEGRSKGCAVVEFKESQDAAQAIKELDGTDIGGRKIRVREDTKGDDVYKEQLKTQKDKLKTQRSAADANYMPQYGGFSGLSGALASSLGTGLGANSMGSAGLGGGLGAGLGGGLGAGLGGSLGAGLGGGLGAAGASGLASGLSGLTGNMALASSIPGLGGLQALLSAQANQAITLLSSLNQKNGDPINCSVFVSNLDYDVPWQRLKDTMRRAGNCLRCDLAVGDNKKSKGFGTVVFETPMEAITAVALFNGIETGVSKRPMSARLDRNANLHQILQQLGIDSSNITQQTLLQLQQLATTAVLNANQISSGTAGLGASSAALANTGGLGTTAGLGTSAGLGNLGSLSSLGSGGLRGYGSSMGAAGYTSGYGVDTPRNSNSGRSSGNPQAKLFVRNLPFSVRWQALKDKFREAGKVEHAGIKLDSENRSKGYGSVTFETVQDAQNAITLFNGYRWDGREIEVKFDRY